MLYCKWRSDNMDLGNGVTQKEEYEKTNKEAQTRFEEAKKVGLKFDTKKLRWELLPLGPIRSVIKVIMLGSEKYADDNWKHVDDWRRRYYAAAMRHLTDWFEGEEIDPESGESHLSHALCCLIFLWANTEDEKKNTKG